ncbi:MAG: bile acid:sodium symporter family protein [Opitutales bacterium]|nr:bile acid:sodium symporter family protein [Opitutales bacterium]
MKIQNRLERIASGATQFFPLWSVLVGVLALVEPSCFMWFGKDAIGWGLGIIMLGMGMTLEPRDFIRVWREPKLVGLGVFSQFLIMPAWGAGLAWVLQLPAEMAVGLILVSSCPGGTASNVVVFLAKANVALSVSLTLVSTILAIFLTPWLMNLYAGHYVPVDSWGLLKSILLVVLLPLLFGLLGRKLFKKSANQVSKVSPFISVLFILLIVGYVLAAKRNIILEHWYTLLIGVVLLHIGGFFLGFMIGILFKRDPIDCRTFSIEVGMQNSGLGMALASKHFSHLPMVPAPCALSAVIHCLIGSVLATWWSRNK